MKPEAVFPSLSFSLSAWIVYANVSFVHHKQQTTDMRLYDDDQQNSKQKSRETFHLNIYPGFFLNTYKANWWSSNIPPIFIQVHTYSGRPDAAAISCLVTFETRKFEMSIFMFQATEAWILRFFLETTLWFKWSNHNEASAVQTKHRMLTLIVKTGSSHLKLLCIDAERSADSGYMMNHAVKFRVSRSVPVPN